MPRRLVLLINFMTNSATGKFYFKLSRFFFCKTFNYLLQNLRDIYSSQLEQMSKNDKETFLEFANLYLNDMIFLLDECLGKMKAMKILEVVKIFNIHRNKIRHHYLNRNRWNSPCSTRNIKDYFSHFHFIYMNTIRIFR